MELSKPKTRRGSSGSMNAKTVEGHKGKFVVPSSPQKRVFSGAAPIFMRQKLMTSAMKGQGSFALTLPHAASDIGDEPFVGSSNQWIPDLKKSDGSSLIVGDCTALDREVMGALACGIWLPRDKLLQQGANRDELLSNAPLYAMEGAYKTISLCKALEVEHLNGRKAQRLKGKVKSLTKSLAKKQKVIGYFERRTLEAEEKVVGLEAMLYVCKVDDLEMYQRFQKIPASLLMAFAMALSKEEWVYVSSDEFNADHAIDSFGDYSIPPSGEDERQFADFLKSSSYVPYSASIALTASSAFLVAVPAAPFLLIRLLQRCQPQINKAL